MLRELEEAVQRTFHVAADGADTGVVASDWESRLHISQVDVTFMKCFGLKIKYLHLINVCSPIEFFG